MNGADTLWALREAVPGLPVIVLSGMIDLPEELKTFASDVIVKGGGAKRLLDSLARLVK